MESGFKNNVWALIRPERAFKPSAPCLPKTLQIRGTEVGGVDCAAVLTDPAGPRGTSSSPPFTAGMGML